MFGTFRGFLCASQTIKNLLAYVHTLECDIASLQSRVDQLEELNKQLTEERDQFLERYYRLVFMPVASFSSA